MAFLCGGSGLVGWFMLPSGGGRGLGRFSIFRCGYRHDACSFGGDYRRHDMDHSEALAVQEKSLEIWKRRWNGDASWKTGTQLTLRDAPEKSFLKSEAVKPPVRTPIHTPQASRIVATMVMRRTRLERR